MNRPNYFNVIDERLQLLALRIISRGKLNILDFHGHSENFYQYFLHELYNWQVINENENMQNVEAIDLIDHSNKYVIQVSATATKYKIESCLSKASIENYNGYTFKFISIAREANELRKNTYANPYEINFTPSIDIIDIQSILSKIRGMKIEDQKRIYEFVKKELIPEPDLLKIETNLASIINILSKENWESTDSALEINSYDIERKITHNNLNGAKVIIDDYGVHYLTINRIYSQFDVEGSNKSSTVLRTIRHEYAKAKSNLSDDQLFFEVISQIQYKVLNSANYSSIPLDELEQCVSIIVVDAFIRCKIFENPNNYAPSR